MSAYATSTGSSYSNAGFDQLNAASVRMKAQTIMTAAAMEDAAAIALLEQHLSNQVPQATHRLRYLADRHAVALGNIIGGIGYR